MTLKSLSRALVHPIAWVKSKPLYNVLGLYFYDLKRFVAHSGALHREHKNQLLAHLMHAYHGIEKGLAMPRFRYGFGKDAIRRLVRLARDFEKEFGCQDDQYKHALGVIKEYYETHLGANQVDFSDEFWRWLKSIVNEYTHIKPTKQIEFTNASFYEHINAPFPVFAKSRHSVRNYGDPLDISRIIASVELARFAPSACNRQPIRVYCVTEKDKIKTLLDIQGGSRGFGDGCDKLLVLTGDLHTGNWIQERNSLWFDAGLFTMNLSYSLHYNKVAHCILNWSNTPEHDAMAMKILQLPGNEEIMIMIACGEAADNFSVPCSPRKDINSIFKIM